MFAVNPKGLYPKRKVGRQHTTIIDELFLSGVEFWESMCIHHSTHSFILNMETYFMRIVLFVDSLIIVIGFH